MNIRKSSRFGNLRWISGGPSSAVGEQVHPGHKWLDFDHAAQTKSGSCGFARIPPPPGPRPYQGGVVQVRPSQRSTRKSWASALSWLVKSGRRRCRFCCELI